MNTIRPTGARHIVVAMLCLGAAIVYLSRNCLGVAVADGQILDDLNLSKKQIGLVMGFGFFLFYSIFQVPSGWLGQRIGSRRILTLILLSSSILTALMGMVTALAGIMVIYLGIGMVQSGIFPCSAKTAKSWVPKTRLALMGGALGSFMSVGGALASMLCGVLLGWTSWRVVFFLFAIPGIIWAIAFYWWFRDEPGDHSSVNSDELNLITGGDMKPVKDSTGAIPWRAMASTPAMWWLCGQQFFRAAGYIFYSTWFPTFLRETRGVSTESAGFLSSLPMLAVVVSCVSGGAFVDYLQRKTGSRRISRQYVAIACMLACAGFICLAYFAETTTMAVLMISAGSFCASFGGPCQYVTTIDMADRDTAVVYGVVNMAGNIGAALFPVVVPYLVASSGWDAVLFTFAGIYVAAAVCWALLNPYATLQNPYATKAAA